MRDRLMRAQLGERFVVTLTTGETFDGLLERVDARTLDLADAHSLSSDASDKLDGKLYLPREQITYMQRL